MVKNLPSNAGDAGSIPGRGTKIPHAAGHLSLHATTTELARLNWSPRAANYRAHTLWNSHHNERRENPHATTREKLTRHNKRCNEDPVCRSEDPMQPNK